MKLIILFFFILRTKSNIHTVYSAIELPPMKLVRECFFFFFLMQEDVFETSILQTTDIFMPRKLSFCSNRENVPQNHKNLDIRTMA